MNILLSGAPFSGKTTVGSALAKLLKLPFVNTDTLIEQQMGMSCTAYYKQSGERAFRELEHSILHEMLSTDGVKVISLGGGILTCPKNALLAKKLGTNVYLNCSVEELYRRLIASGRKPAYLDADDLRGSFAVLMAEREPSYRQHADFVVDVTSATPEEACKHISLAIFHQFKQYNTHLTG